MHGDEVLIPLIFFISIAAIAITHLTTRHRERMTVIAKGLNADEIKALYLRDLRPRDQLTSLKWGLLFVFAGLAILVGNYLHERFMVDESVVVGMVCIFAGIALLLFYALAARKQDGSSWGAGKTERRHPDVA